MPCPTWAFGWLRHDQSSWYQALGNSGSHVLGILQKIAPFSWGVLTNHKRGSSPKCLLLASQTRPP